LAKVLNMIMPFQSAYYDGFQGQLNRRWRNNSLIGVVYTFSKAINYQDNDANPRIPWTGAWHRNKGLASYDRPHNFQMYGVWDLPFGKGQRWVNNSFLSKLVGGWQINGIMSIMSGTPFYVVQGNAANLNAGGSGQVPDQINPIVAILGGIGVGNPYFDRSAYQIVNIPSGQPQRFGSAGRNNLRGPRFFNVDFGVFRNFQLTERFGLQFRAESFNVLNHPNFGNPNGDISSNNFGFITGTTGTGERNWRFALRLSF
jgi:hypothetical protein